MQQNYFFVSTKNFAISMKFWLLKRNVLLGQHKTFCWIHFFFGVQALIFFFFGCPNKILVLLTKILVGSSKSFIGNATKMCRLYIRYPFANTVNIFSPCNYAIYFG